MNALKSVLLASAIFATPAWPRLDAQGAGGYGVFTIDPTTGMSVQGIPVDLDPDVEANRLDVDFDNLVLSDILSAISIATDDRVRFDVRTPTMIAVVPGPNWQPEEPKQQVVNRDGDRVVELIEAAPPPEGQASPKP